MTITTSLLAKKNEMVSMSALAIVLIVAPLKKRGALPMPLHRPAVTSVARILFLHAALPLLLMIAALSQAGAAQTSRILGGAAVDIGANASGAVWVVGTNPVPGGYTIWRWNNGNWQNIPGGGLRISVDPDGTAWMVNNTHTIFHSNASGQWTTVPGGATDIGVGGNGAVWIIGANGSDIEYAVFAPGTRTVVGWKQVAGGASRIAVDPNGNAWVVNGNGSIYHWQGTNWTLLPGFAKDVAVGADGTAYVVGTNPSGAGGSAVYQWNASISNWSQIGVMAANVAAGPKGSVYVTQDSTQKYAILAISGVPTTAANEMVAMQKAPPGGPGPITGGSNGQPAQEAPAANSGASGQTIVAGFNYCWRDRYGRGAGQPLSMNSSDCPSGTVKDPHGLLCYPPCQAGYDMVGPVCWHRCPSGWGDNGVDCIKPGSASYDRSSGPTYAWVGGDLPFDSSGQFKRCQAANPQGCEQIPPGLINLVYPKCRSGYAERDSNHFICDSAAASCPSGMTDLKALGMCQKDSYGNTAGKILGCAPGSEQSGLLCYPQCKSGYHAVGPVCYADCPASWVQCGAGCAKDNATCGEQTAQQVLSVVQAAVQIAVTVASMGTATPGIDAARQGEADLIAEELASESEHPGGSPEAGGGEGGGDQPNTTQTEPNPNPTTTPNPRQTPLADLNGTSPRLQNLKQQMDAEIGLLVKELQGGGSGRAADAVNATETQIDSELNLLSKEIENGGASQDQIQSSLTKIDTEFDTMAQDARNAGDSTAAESIDADKTEFNAQIHELIDFNNTKGPTTKLGGEGNQLSAVDQLKTEGTQVNSQLNLLAKEIKNGGSKGLTDTINTTKAQINDELSLMTKEIENGKASTDQINSSIRKINTDFNTMKLDARNAGDSTAADSINAEQTQFNTQAQEIASRIDKTYKTTADVNTQESNLASELTQASQARASGLFKNPSSLQQMQLEMQQKSQLFSSLEQIKTQMNGGRATATQLNSAKSQLDGQFDQLIKTEENSSPTSPTTQQLISQINTTKLRVDADLNREIANELGTNSRAANGAASAVQQVSYSNRAVLPNGGSGLTAAQKAQLSQSLQSFNFKNMTPAQQQQALAAAAQLAGSANLAKGCAAMGQLTTEQVQAAFAVAANNSSSNSNNAANNNSYTVVSVSAPKSSSTPMAPPSLSSLLPIQDVVNKITTASNSDLSPEAKNMQIAMASLEAAAALDPTGVTSIVAAYTKPLCSLVLKQADNNPPAVNAPVVDLDAMDTEQLRSSVMGGGSQ